MSAGICIIAHEPLASALKSCAQHIFSATGDTHCDEIACFDVPNDVRTDEGEAKARQMIQSFRGKDVLILTDIAGATPSNIAHRLLDTPNVRVITGTNLPALITALSHINDSFGQLVTLTEGAAHGGISSSLSQPLSNRS
ncbi:MAG: PTS fructose transporter subunit IIA [Sutterella sp.]|nr:PTS fructose transporter subunit IIA [Sutterella sp.]